MEPTIDDALNLEQQMIEDIEEEIERKIESSADAFELMLRKNFEGLYTDEQIQFIRMGFNAGYVRGYNEADLDNN